MIIKIKDIEDERVDVYRNLRERELLISMNQIPACLL